MAWGNPELADWCAEIATQISKSMATDLQLGSCRCSHQMRKYMWFRYMYL
jgi:hypothetical protein